MAALNYIAKYASKGEHASTAYLDLLNTLISEHEDNSPARTVITKLLISTVGERDYSAQEVVHILVGWSLYSSSRNFVTLNVTEDDWIPVTQRIDDHEARTSETLIQKYRKRPPAYEYISLLNFVKKYNVVGSRIVERRQVAVVRIFPILNLCGESENDQRYYLQQCILHIPFRGTFAQILAESQLPTWLNLFEHHRLTLQENLDFPQPGDEGEVPREQNVDDVREPYMIAAMFMNNGDNPALGRRLEDLIEEWVGLPKRVAVQGKAGSGKSTIIKEIVRITSETLGEDYTRVCAPTGVAAINIEGTTAHSLFRLPLCASAYKPLTGASARSFQNELKNLKVLIIDEMSMVGASLLAVIEKRCREISPESYQRNNLDENNIPFFGDLIVYLFGDYRQLPPVMDTPVYAKTFRTALALDGKLAFDSFTMFIQLSHSHRQREGTSHFRNLLDRLGDRKFSPDDYQLLISRRTSMLSVAERQVFKDNAIRLYPRNGMVTEGNEQRLAATNFRVTLISSHNEPDIATNASEDKALGLPSVLKLSVGARVMLRINLWVKGGLVSGSLGTIAAIVYENNERPLLLPAYILVKFDNYSGPFLGDRTFPIVPITRSFNVK
ncbi:ATP-dependent DNA helicase PIF1-like [Megachile rotundata]|uniref:ATP-dependent DNA helicase PIF1-like n=1 Tax=Megachile rotundata TaxID=143995 RepID=UPI003FD4F99F